MAEESEVASNSNEQVITRLDELFPDGESSLNRYRVDGSHNTLPACQDSSSTPTSDSRCQSRSTAFKR